MLYLKSFHLPDGDEEDGYLLSYPYQLEIGSLGKMFQNVYPDLSWAYLLSPNGAKSALSDNKQIGHACELSESCLGFDDGAIFWRIVLHTQKATANRYPMQIQGKHRR